MNKYLLLYVSCFWLFSCGDTDIKQGETLFLRHKGCDMPAYVYGNTASNTFMILLHGGPGGNGLEYRGGVYAENLEKEIAVVYWDQRGQGNSKGNNHAEELTMDLLLDDLDQLVFLLKHQYGEDINLFLYGHSWGGTYGTKYLMSKKRQQQFNGWIESNGAHDIPKLNKLAIEFFQFYAREYIGAGINVTKWQEIQKFVNSIDTLNITDEEALKLNQFGHEAEELFDEIKQPDEDEFQMPLRNPIDVVSSVVTGNYTSQKLDENGIEEIALSDSLYKIELPTFIQTGRYDFVVPPALGFYAYNRISSKEKTYKQYSYSGHSPMVNEGVEYAEDILTFIRKNKK